VSVGTFFNYISHQFPSRARLLLTHYKGQYYETLVAMRQEAVVEGVASRPTLVNLDLLPPQDDFGGKLDQ
jgi:hypothetical protein